MRLGGRLLLLAALSLVAGCRGREVGAGACAGSFMVIGAPASLVLPGAVERVGAGMFGADTPKPPPIDR
jgi:hypothetical protein